MQRDIEMSQTQRETKLKLNKQTEGVPFTITINDDDVTQEEEQEMLYAHYEAVGRKAAAANWNSTGTQPESWTVNVRADILDKERAARQGLMAKAASDPKFAAELIAKLQAMLAGQ